MARYDVFSHHQGSGYLLDIQADLLEGLNNRIVVPLLLPQAAPKLPDGLILCLRLREKTM